MDYDVALSFAGQDRPYVVQVARALSERGIRVFYDEYERANLWGKDIYEHFSFVYGSASKFCIIFISSHYAKRLWTTHERRSAQAQAFRAHKEFILPARFDSTTIPGIPETIAYVDLNSTTPAELASLIEAKLASDSRLISSSSMLERFGYSPHDTSFGLRGAAEFQGFLTKTHANSYRDWMEINQKVMDGILSMQIHPDEIWNHSSNDDFDRIYATSSVITYFAQIGMSMQHKSIRSAFDYLSEKAATPNIDNRAAVMALSSLGYLDYRLEEAFLHTLREHQISDANSINCGSFLLKQHASRKSVDLSTANWDEDRYHKDGASFHACHIGEFLLHVKSKNENMADDLAELMNGISGFLQRSFTGNKGYLIDRSGEPSAVTLYGYAVASRGGIELPRNWRNNVDEIIKLLTGSKNLFFRSLGIMNVYYIYYSRKDELFRSTYKGYVEQELDFLCRNFESFAASARDLSILGRTVLYGGTFLARSWPLVTRGWTPELS